MVTMVLGLLVFFGIHTVPMQPALREGLIERFGAEAHKEQWLPGLLAGEIRQRRQTFPTLQAGVVGCGCGHPANIAGDAQCCAIRNRQRLADLPVYPQASQFLQALPLL